MSRRVLITGGSRGIGRAVVFAFASAGDSVAFSWSTDDQGTAITQAGAPGSTALRADLRDPEATERLVPAAVERLGGLDVLVNCAGIYPHSAFTETRQQVVADVLRVNVVAPIELMRQAAPYLRESAYGSIVNVTSINATAPDAGLSAYDASKAALAQATRTAALELGSWGVRVNAVAPGLVNDPGLADGAPERIASFVRHAPLGRVVEPGEIAAAILFLASAESSAITGQTLVVDAGVTLAGYTVD